MLGHPQPAPHLLVRRARDVARKVPPPAPARRAAPRVSAPPRLRPGAVPCAGWGWAEPQLVADRLRPGVGLREVLRVWRDLRLAHEQPRACVARGELSAPRQAGWGLRSQPAAAVGNRTRGAAGWVLHRASHSVREHGSLSAGRGCGRGMLRQCTSGGRTAVAERRVSDQRNGVQVARALTCRFQFGLPSRYGFSWPSGSPTPCVLAAIPGPRCGAQRFTGRKLEPFNCKAPNRTS